MANNDQSAASTPITKIGTKIQGAGIVIFRDISIGQQNRVFFIPVPKDVDPHTKKPKIIHWSTKDYGGGSVVANGNTAIEIWGLSSAEEQQVRKMISRIAPNGKPTVEQVDALLKWVRTPANENLDYSACRTLGLDSGTKGLGAKAAHIGTDSHRPWSERISRLLGLRGNPYYFVSADTGDQIDPLKPKAGVVYFNEYTDVKQRAVFVHGKVTVDVPHNNGASGTSMVPTTFEDGALIFVDRDGKVIDAMSREQATREMRGSDGKPLKTSGVGRNVRVGTLTNGVLTVHHLGENVPGLALENMGKLAVATSSISFALTALLVIQRGGTMATELSRDNGRDVTAQAFWGGAAVNSVADLAVILKAGGPVGQRIATGFAAAGGLVVGGALVINDFLRNDGAGMAYDLGAIGGAISGGTIGGRLSAGVPHPYARAGVIVGSAVAGAAIGDRIVVYSKLDERLKRDVNQYYVKPLKENVAWVRAMQERMAGTPPHAGQPLDTQEMKHLAEVKKTLIATRQVTHDQPDNPDKAGALKLIDGVLAVINNMQFANTSVQKAYLREKYLTDLTTVEQNFQNGNVKPDALEKVATAKNFLVQQARELTALNGQSANIGNQEARSWVNNMSDLLNGVLEPIEALETELRGAINENRQNSRRTEHQPDVVKQAVAQLTLSTPIASTQPEQNTQPQALYPVVAMVGNARQIKVA